MPPMLPMLLLLILLLAPNNDLTRNLSAAVVEAAVPCQSDGDCERMLRPGSICRPSRTCSNPYEGGCLRRMLGEERFPALRVCNTDDVRLGTISGAAAAAAAAASASESTEDGRSSDGESKEEVCVPPVLNYTEIRVAAGNWESSMFLAFLLQIILSELVGVPMTVETSSADKILSFYDPDYAFPYPSKAYPFEALERAHDAPGGDCAPALARGQSCSHLLPEVWNGQEKQWIEAQSEGYAESPEGNGMVGKVGWYVPSFVAADDPSFVSFYGLRGHEHREKLADVFRTPTNWSDYCTLVSADGCADDDGVARRAPTDDDMEAGLGGKYRVSDVYAGHFRRTPQSNCTAYPDACTGHFVDCPCSWSTNAAQQLYWNEIHLESRGPLSPNGGYSYGDMLDIWIAANETRSPVMMWWWRPDPTLQVWEGTSGAFQPVSLPEPTEVCQKNRISSVERCDDDVRVRRGLEEGKCGDEAHALQKIVAASLGEVTYRSPASERSPAYDVIKSFRVGDLAVDAMLKNWISRGKDTYGFDPRETVCEWVADNLDRAASFVPRGYPRVLVDEGWFGGGAAPLLYAGFGLGIAATVAVAFVSALTHRHRKKRVFVYAQYNFLVMILSGFVLTSIASIVYGLEPTRASCTARQWLVVMGYTLGLVPLLVKVAAINKISQGAKRMKRVHLTPVQLMGTVAAIALAVIAFLVAWTVVDPVTRREELVLVEEKGEVVEVRISCKSDDEGWTIAALSWEVLLLVCATVLSFQARNVRQEFNESRSLSSLVYSHFVFMAVRAVVYLLAMYGVLATNVQAGVTSLMLSLDTVAAIVIYLGPKYYRALYKGDGASYSGRRSEPSEWGASVAYGRGGGSQYGDSQYLHGSNENLYGRQGQRRSSNVSHVSSGSGGRRAPEPLTASTAERANEIWQESNKRRPLARFSKEPIAEVSNEDRGSRGSGGSQPPQKRRGSDVSAGSRGSSRRLSDESAENATGMGWHLPSFASRRRSSLSGDGADLSDGGKGRPRSLSGDSLEPSGSGSGRGRRRSLSGDGAGRRGSMASQKSGSVRRVSWDDDGAAIEKELERLEEEEAEAAAAAAIEATAAKVDPADADTDADACNGSMETKDESGGKQKGPEGTNGEALGSGSSLPSAAPTSSGASDEYPSGDELSSQGSAKDEEKGKEANTDIRHEGALPNMVKPSEDEEEPGFNDDEVELKLRQSDLI